MLDRDRSLDLALHLISLDCWEEQCCWANAISALRRWGKRKGTAVYVEGWCAVPAIHLVQPHGWIELEDGTILDPTYVYADSSEEVQLDYEYYPAVRYQREELKGIRIRSTQKRLPLVERFYGFGGWGHEAYKAAYFDAYRRIGIQLEIPPPLHQDGQGIA